jgi:pilus assembly protein FimV
MFWGKRKHMNLRKIAVQLFIMLNFVTAVHAADFQQVQLKGPKNASDQFSGIVYGPIESSDTLWQISQRYRKNNALSIYQVMQAIYELNPDAFERQNINLLRNGSMLKLPSERYIARVSSQQARQKAERDSQKLQSNNGSSAAVSSSKSPNAQQQTAANAQALDQTKELIEQKLGAIDEAQTRQFMAIRKQFAESISSVQSILDENQRLFERLDKVNTDIDEMRSEEQQKSLQMNQMGASIEELLEKSRQDDAAKAAQMAEQNTSLLDNPLTLILAFTLPALLVLAAFAYWMIKRKSPTVVKPVEDDIDDLSLDPLAAEMDDLSDALSAELSQGAGDELDDDNLFGDDDLLDDVLSEELEESLDDALQDSIEEPLVDDSEIFDELGDDDLNDVLEEEFEVGAEVVEQDDLDSLFDEDDDLLAEVDEVEEDLVDDLLAEVQDGDDNSDLDNMLIEEDEQQVDAQVDDMEYEEDESLLAPVADDEEQPEISIDELLDAAADQSVETPLIDDSEGINEEVLQNLDKEIVSQNEELDSVTGSLIDELEQVEQMRSMMPEDEEELSDAEEPQLDIQKLDDLAEEIDDDLLGDDIEEDAIEIDISEVLNETIQSSEVEEVFEPPESQGEAEPLAEPEQAEETEALVAPEQAEETEALVAPEQAEETEESVAPEQADEAEALVAPEQADEAAEPVAPEQAEETEEPIAPEQAVEIEEPIAPEQAVETEEPVAPEQEDEIEEPIAPEQAEETEEPVAPEQADEIEEPIAPEQAVETEEPVVPEQADEATELVAPEQADDVEELLEAEFDTPASSDSTLDEDQLEKALEDFEKEELDEVLEDLTSNESASISSLDDLEFSADEFVTKDQTTAAVSKQQPTLDDIDSIEDFDDSELDSAFDETIVGSSFASSQSSGDELDDVPGLGDWLGDDAVKPGKQPSGASEDKDIIDELEGASFDDMLESIDLDDDLSVVAEDDTGFDIAALLDESPQSEKSDVNEPDTEDFLDVEALLNESVGAESDDEIDKALDLDVPLEPFVNEFDNLEMIDVDADDGLGAKLDLAHAYIEIGEEESAKELLDEILQKGSAEQVAAAKKVLDKLD